MADEADRGNEQAEATLELALAAQRARAIPETHPDFDGAHCVDCDNEIPPLRLAMWKCRCVECQSVLERRGAMRGVPA